MPKYIFRPEEYIKLEGEFQDYTHTEYTGSTVQTGRTYYQTKVRGFKVPGGDTSDVWMGVNSFAPGGVYGTHKHQTSQFYYVLCGKAKVRVGDEERVAEKDTWIFVPADVDHYLENTFDEEFTYILIGGNPPKENIA